MGAGRRLGYRRERRVYSARPHGEELRRRASVHLANRRRVIVFHPSEVLGRAPLVGVLTIELPVGRKGPSGSACRFQRLLPPHVCDVIPPLGNLHTNTLALYQGAHLT